MDIEKEIKQGKFRNAIHKASVNIIFTSGWLSMNQSRILKPFGVSLQQFNILRILRGQFPNPATVRLLQERMLDKMSNASRLVEKLRKKGFVERTECEDDRRRVDVLISRKGLDVLDKLDIIFNEVSESLQKLTEEESTELSRLLDKFRG